MYRKIYAPKSTPLIALNVIKRIHHVYHVDSTRLFGRREVALEPVDVRQAQLNNHPVATHQQTGEADGPKVEIALWQPPNVCLEILRHVIIMVPLIAKCPQKVEHARAGVFALLAEIVLEISRQ